MHGAIPCKFSSTPGVVIPMCRCIFAFFVFLLHGWLPIYAARPSDQAHPRLLFPASVEAEVRDKIASDPLAATLQNNILKRADEVIQSRTCRFEKKDGRRLLAESRLALHHILHCAWAWRTTADKKYFNRVIAEMDAACAMPHWNPDHFLDTAEMSAAMAIGFDWLYHDLSAEQRVKYADEIDRKGLQALIQHPHPWWNNATNNWAQVCGTGMEFAAIAIDEVQPQRCAQVMEQSKKLLEKCIHFYLPDGAYPEGPGYWHYGTNYQVLHMAAQPSLFGKTPIADIWRRSAEFMVHMEGPTGLSFNFADGGTGKSVPTAAQTWIAAQFPQSALPARNRDALKEYLATSSSESIKGGDRLQPLHLLWLPKSVSEKVSPPALTARFGGEQEIALARTSWDRDAAWIGIKGGTGAASHGHLDAGSFVYDAAGVRWFIDLGKENYNLPGYFGSRRWEYFRLKNHSHNTLVIGDALQEAPMPGCPVTTWSESGSLSTCQINLTAAYAKQCASAMRSVSFDRGSGRVEMSDSLRKPIGSVRWAVVTDAKVEIKDRQVIFRKSGKTLVLQRDDEAGGSWQEFSLKPPTDQENDNEGYCIIGFIAPAQEQLDLRVSWQINSDKKSP